VNAVPVVHNDHDKGREPADEEHVEKGQQGLPALGLEGLRRDSPIVKHYS
jgi:hypothetical protein